jgi:hypothetical protein
MPWNNALIPNKPGAALARFKVQKFYSKQNVLVQRNLRRNGYINILTRRCIFVLPKNPYRK